MTATAENALRGLASYLGVGDCNPDKVDPEVFERKIRDGIDMLVQPLQERLKQTEQQRDALTDALRRCIEEPGPESAKHAREILASVGAHEPMFVLRAKDRLAPSVIHFWTCLAEVNGCPAAKIESAQRCIDAMKAWGGPKKLPD